jgi:bifunctional N-acetylglucosamine-1-phosphate-uridyltransferase/glucosamine-1-phosphate-acetyltransferase GlmU-like protein
MIQITSYIQEFKQVFPGLEEELPWDITSAAQLIVAKQIKTLGADYTIKENIAIHKDAHIEEHVIIKGPVIISANCFVGSHAYLRNGVFLSNQVSIGPGCEIKSSLVFSNSVLAHFNFIGDCIVGTHVNMEAGSVVANYFNERKDKTIKILSDGEILSTGIDKFGALIGDHTKIGSNAVLSPGTVLSQKSIVKRLELVEQIRD